MNNIDKINYTDENRNVAGGNTFLRKLALEIIEMSDGKTDNVHLILPGKRARLFFLNELASVIDKPIWAPDISTMEEFVFNSLGLKPIDELELVLSFWEICKNTPEVDLTFEQFSGWATVALSDYSEVDMFLVEPDQVFKNLKDAKEIELWDPGRAEQLTEFELKYLKFYDNLLPWYKKLSETLLSKGVAWQGLAFRMLGTNEELLQSGFKNKKLVFAGFNAFTPAENKIVKALLADGTAVVRWDADEWYVRDKKQEAGLFIRGWIEKNHKEEFKWLENRLKLDNKEISVYGVSGNRAQTVVAGNILAKMGGGSVKTAVVIPDETLLLPMLNAVPPEIQKFNVTMGLPYSHTAAWSWLQINLNLFVPTGDSENKWIRMSGLISLLRHPWFKMLLQSSEEPPGTEYQKKLKGKFVTFDELREVFVNGYPHAAQFFNDFFSPVASPTDFLRKIELSIRQVLSDSSINDKPFDQGAAIETLRVLKVVSSMKEIVEDDENSFSVLKYTITRILRSVKIPFTGKPLEGVQILGLLETRNLDFEHVIILSANENILPPAKKPLTMIPTDMRIAYKLPGVIHQDAIVAYHFYHLLQRAAKIDIIYNTDTTTEQVGEASRFILQLEKELSIENPNITFTHSMPAVEVNAAAQIEPIVFEKSEELINILKFRLQNSKLSPTTLSKYIKCKLMFFFSFVAGIKEPESYSDVLEAKDLGSIVHAVLQQIYQEADNNGMPSKTETRNFYEKKEIEIQTAVDNEMKMFLGNSSDIKGLNVIIGKIATYQIMKLLEKERNALKGVMPEILFLESTLQRGLNVSGFDFNFLGKVDRIDKVGDVVRIIDYKTGKVNLKEFDSGNIKRLFTDSDYEMSLQLMLYLWMFSGDRSDNNFSAGIMPLKNNQQYYLELDTLKELSHQEFADIMNTFQDGLAELCAEIIDPDIPFEQTEVTKTCRYCPYKPICGRNDY